MKNYKLLAVIFPILSIIACFSHALHCQELVADVNPDTRDGFLRGFHTNGEEAVFFVTDPVLGTELYKIPGPNQEPVRFFEELPGRVFQVRHSVLIDSLLFFSRGSIGLVQQLYRANLNTGDIDEIQTGDISKFGVEKLGDLTVLLMEEGDDVTLYANPVGTQISEPLARVSNTGFGSFRDAVELRTTDSLLFFVTRDPSFSYNLYRTNGTAEGTYQVFESVSTSGSSSPPIIELKVFRNRVYFSTREGGATADNLFRTNVNGDGVNVVRIETENGRPVSPRNLQVYNDSLWFSGNGDWSEKLFAIARDSVFIIRQLSSQSNSPREMVVNEGMVYWVTNGRIFGGALSDDSVSNLGNLSNGEELRGPSSMTVSAENKLFFRGVTPGVGEEVWAINPGSLSPYLVEDIYPGPIPSLPGPLSSFGSYIYFRAKGGCLGYELFNANGSGAENVLEANASGADANPDNMFAHNGQLYFSAVTGATGREVFVSDGTGEGTRLLHDVTPGRVGNVNLQAVSLGDYVYYTTADYSGLVDAGRGFYRTNGTQDEPTELFQRVFENINVRFSPPVVFKEKIYVTARYLEQTFLFAYDPIEEKLDTVVRYFVSEYAFDPRIVIFDEEQFTFRSWSPEGRIPFISDGTTAGTRPLPELLESGLVFGTRFQNSIIYPQETVDGEVLYRSDGTLEGTYAITNPEQPFSRVRWDIDFEAINDTLYFFGLKDNKYRLYGTVGTPEDYFEIPTEDGASINLGKRIEYIDGTIYIAADQPDFTGPALYRTNSQKTSLIKVSDVIVGPLANVPRAMRAHNGYLFFNGYTEAYGEELYRSDGTEEGTIRLTDISPNEGFGRPLNFYSFNESLYFAASDGESGMELWRFNPDNEIYGTDPFAGAVCPVLPTSVMNAEEDDQLQLFPNPADNFVTITFTGEEDRWLTITTVEGQPVVINSSYHSGEVIDVAHLRSGVYIVSLKNRLADVVSSRKLIVKK
jgi:ELWxxDGT repeat protein